MAAARSERHADDPHDEVLLRNVAPGDRGVPEPRGAYHLVVVGAGTAGLVTAAGAAGVGARVALVERHRMGGDCLNTGCVPSKALLRAARAAASVRTAAEFGIATPGGAEVDFPAVMERLRRLRASISRHDSAERFRGLGVDVYFGEARFGKDGRSVQVGGRTLRFGKAVVCTGARPLVPPVSGLREALPLTSDTLFEIRKLPRRLVVVGGGPIGCEMAQAFARLGSQVVLVEAAGDVLAREDVRASRLVRDSLLRDGAEIRTNTTVVEVRTTSGGHEVHVRCGEDRGVLSCERILVAVGRAPNVEGMGLEDAGVAWDPRGGVRVDDRLRTTNPRIFAAGDVCSPHKFTHAADFAARIVIRNALFFGRAKASAMLIPRCTYTSPEVAQVGLTVAEAVERRIPVTVLEQSLDQIDRAVLDGETNGFVQVVLRQGTDVVLGATVVAEHAGDLVSEIAVAMRNGIGLRGIGATIHPYPTRAEAIRRLGDRFERSRLTPLAARLLKCVLALATGVR